ncbi:MAG: hypothetical protein HY692_04525 [Cyanobacteria bacterium NC_groundwater_1444_Ag_S-0.65um_54_12]|nr:hypothetical protein [Cyanobacteria bacterium NC_groundwater_1444_Ag_S-0.65um_54_12]
MLPLKEILLQTGRLLAQHPVLMLPPLAWVIPGTLLLRPGEPTAQGLVVVVAIGLLQLALTTGLIAMVRAAALGEAVGWDAFLIGIGRHFITILTGTVIFLGLLLLTLLPLLILLELYSGPLDLKLILAKGTIPVEQWATAQRWLVGLGCWAMLWSTIAFFLLVWKQAVIVATLSWAKAWRASLAFVSAYWFRLSILLTLKGLLLVFGMLLIAGGIVLLAELGALTTLIIDLYFTIAFTVAFIGPPPPKGETVDAAA